MSHLKGYRGGYGRITSMAALLGTIPLWLGAGAATGAPRAGAVVSPTGLAIGAQASNVATAQSARHTPGRQMVIRVRGQLPGVKAKIVIKGPDKFHKLVQVAHRKILRKLAPGVYRVKAKQMESGGAVASVARSKVRVRIRSNRGAVVLFRYQIRSAPAARPPLAADEPKPLGTIHQTPDEADVIRLTNEARSKARRCGGEHLPAVPPLTYNAKLNLSARLHSQDMAAKGYFAHQDLQGRMPWDRMDAVGYDHHWAGENIGAAYSKPVDVVHGWLDSPAHCANIMKPEFEELGVGLATGGEHHVYWTQNFGTQP